MSNEYDDDDVYTPIPISDGDKITVKVTHTFLVNGQTQWATAEANIAVLPEETSDEASERAQAIALGTAFQTAENLATIIDAKREAALQAKKTKEIS